MSRVFTALFALGAAALLAVLLLFRNAVLDTGPPPVQGAAVYRQACAQCHGPAGGGMAGFAPPLRGRALAPEMIKGIVRAGRGKMPAQPRIRGAALENLARYVAGLK